MASLVVARREGHALCVVHHVARFGRPCGQLNGLLVVHQVAAKREHAWSKAGQVLLLPALDAILVVHQKDLSSASSDNVVYFDGLQGPC